MSSGLGGTNLTSDLTKLIQVANAGGSSFVVNTDTKPALFVDNEAKVGINTLEPSAQLEVVNDTGECVALRNGDSETAVAKLNVSETGDLELNLQTTNAKVKATSVDVSGHNGTSRGLHLNGELVTASATQLNYTTATPGTASAQKAVVLDNNKSISGLTSVSATNITGTVQTAAQPNITEVGTLNSLNVTNNVSANTLTGTLQTSAQPNITQVGTLDSLNVTNGVSASTLSGTLQTAAQPNITSIGNLASVTVAGSQIRNEAAFLSGAVAGAAANSKVMVLSNTGSISGVNSLSANELSGTLQTGPQPNITQVGTLSTLNVTNRVTASQLAGQLQTAAQPNITSVGNLTSLSVAGNSVSAEVGYLSGSVPGTANASKVVILNSQRSITGLGAVGATTLSGTLQTAAQPNITQVGNLSSLSVAGNSVSTEVGYLSGAVPGTAANGKALVLNNSGSISGISSLSATSLSGSLQTAAQPNITSLGTLNSLTVGGSAQVNSTSDASSATSGGALTVSGGAAVAKKMYVGNDLHVTGRIFMNGSLVGTGGAGFNPYLADITEGSAFRFKALVTDGDTSISGINVLGATKATLSSTTDSSSATDANAAISVAGGAAIAKKLYVGSDLYVSGTIYMNGSPITSGGSSISSTSSNLLSMSITNTASIADLAMNGTVDQPASTTWVARTSPSSTWSSVCWSPELRLFVAVANGGTNRLMTSSDYITWTARASANDSNNWTSVCWSPQLSLFVAVASSGTNRVMTSSNGTTWTARSSANESNGWTSVCWSPQLSLFVAVAVNGTNRVMTSSNGIDWTVRAPSSDSNSWNSVCWSPELSLFVAVAYNGSNRVMTSPNGITWTARTSSNESNLWYSVCWSPQLSLFVAVAGDGLSNRVMTSPNGITWTGRASSNESSGWNSVCWSPELSLFVAVSYSGTNRVMTSSNGINWTGITSAGESNQWYSVCWSAQLSTFVAVAGNGTNRVMTSSSTFKGSSISFRLYDTPSLTTPGATIRYIAQSTATGEGDLAFFNKPSGSTTLAERMRITSTGVVNIPSTTASTNANTGALVVSGGVGIGGDASFAGSISITPSNKSIVPTNSTPSGGQLSLASGSYSSTVAAGSYANMAAASIQNSTINSTNAITIANAAGLFIDSGPTAGTNTSIMRRWSLRTAGRVSILDTTAAVSATTAALVVSGGISTNSNIYISGGTSSLTTSSPINNHALQLHTESSGSVGAGSAGTSISFSISSIDPSIATPGASIRYITQNTSIGCGDLVFYNKSSSSTSTGSITETMRINASGTITIPSTTASASSSTGALVVSGGVGIGGALNVSSMNVSGNGSFSSTTDASSATDTSAAITVSGGAAIAKKLYVGTDLYVSGAIYMNGSPITSGGGANSNMESITITDTASIADLAMNGAVSETAGNTWVARLSTNESNDWYSVCWSAELSLFVAVASNGTNRIMTSPDGVTWTGGSVPSSNWYSVCWSPELSLFVAVASIGPFLVITSPDGITWTGRSLPTNEANSNWVAVCWSSQLSLFVAVATTGSHKVMTSPNGIDWTGRSVPNPTFIWNSICWSPELSLFVATVTSGSNQVITSPDGITWTTRSTPSSFWISSCWSAELSLFVVVAYTGSHKVMTSPDGINWTARTSSNETNQWRSVCWAPELSLFVAVAMSGTNRVMTSPDGINWTGITSAGESNQWQSVCWSPELSTFVAVAGSGTNRVMTSSSSYRGSSITFSLYDAPSLTTPGATIEYIPQSTETGEGDLAFFSKPSGSTTLVERMRITSAGVGIGGTLNISGKSSFSSTTDASSATDTSAAITVSGGAAIAKKLYVGTDLYVSGTIYMNGNAIGTGGGSSSPYLTDITPGTAAASKALVLDSSSNISGINSLSASQLTGQIQTAAQPNITSVGTLGSLTVTNGITAGSLTATTITGSLASGPQTGITGVGTLGSLTVTNGITAGSLTATTITGSLAFGPQAGITGVGTLGSLTVSGNGSFSSTTDASSATDTSAAITVSGGAAIAKKLYVGSDLYVSGIIYMNGTPITSGGGASSNMSSITISGTTTTADLLMNGAVSEPAGTWVARLSANESNSWQFVCWAPELSLFVAVSNSGTNRVMTSPDGDTWTGRASSNESNSWRSVCWSSQLSMFVAVAINGTNRVMTSSDGITWTGRASADESTSWASVCWSPELSLFVAVGNNANRVNQIMTSSNGITWTARTSTTNDANNWLAVCWSPQRSLFVAVAMSGTNRVMTSSNGITWTLTASSNETNQWRSVCWSPERSLFVAVAMSGTNRVMTSPDGITWTGRTSSNESNSWNWVCWSSELSMFVAIATSGTNLIMTSSDGFNWTGRASTNESNAWATVCWSPQLSTFVAVSATGTNRVMKSSASYRGSIISFSNPTLTTPGATVQYVPQNTSEGDLAFFSKSPGSTTLAERMRITSAGVVNILSTLSLQGTSATITPTNGTPTGTQLALSPASYTSSVAAGTYVNAAVCTIGRPTITSTNAITITNASALYIDNSPSAGTNTTITDSWALHVGSGRVNIADTTSTSSATTGALVVNGGIGVGGAIFCSSTVRASSLNVVNAISSTSLQSASINNNGTFYNAPGNAVGTTSDLMNLYGLQLHVPTSPTIGSTYRGASIAFHVSSGAASVSTVTPGCAIRYVPRSSNGGDLVFFNKSTSSTSTAALSETMRIGNNGVVTVPASTASTSTSTGALVVTGGVGIGGAINAQQLVIGSVGTFGSNGWIGSGTTTPTCPIDVPIFTNIGVSSGWGYDSTGGAAVPGGTLPVSLITGSSIWCKGIVYSTSDERLKTNIQPITNDDADKLLQITPVTYNWKKHPDSKRELGFIAQDLANAGLVDLVNVVPNDEVDDGVSLVVMYDRIAALNTQINKRQQKEIDELKQTVAELKDLVQQLLNKK